MKTILVIYHRADFDGIFSREIARLRFGDDAEYLGWDYGDPVPEIAPHITALYMLDISIPELMRHSGLIWIDHHKTAIEQFSKNIPGWRMEGVAACRLTWQWFFGLYDLKPWPTREDFVERRIAEPLAVRLAGEYDIWDKRDPKAELFQHGLRSEEILDWKALLCPWPEQHSMSPNYIEILLEAGQILQRARTRENASIIIAQGFDLKFEGLNFIACNAARFNSLLFTAALTPEHDGCLGFCWNGRQERWRVSLYGVPGKPDLDFSRIAKKYGGGGHPQACGFSCKTLPFEIGVDPVRESLKRLLEAEQSVKDAPDEPPVAAHAEEGGSAS
jgi:hypothetical protein